MSTSPLVLPGQPLSTNTANANAAATALEAGPGTFARDGSIFSSVVGKLQRDSATNSVKVNRNETTPSIPDTNSTVIGTITRLTRLQATMSILSVDGRPCREDFQGVIRSQDVRMTEKDKVKMWDCFRPGDVVRATVISLGDSRSYYLSTARNELGVVMSTSAETGNALEPISWEEMRDPSTGTVERRKVAGPE